MTPLTPIGPWPLILSEWGEGPERDMWSLGAMGWGPGLGQKFFRRRRRRRRRRRHQKIGYLTKAKSFRFCHIAEIRTRNRREIDRDCVRNLFCFHEIGDFDEKSSKYQKMSLKKVYKIIFKIYKIIYKYIKIAPPRNKFIK